MATNPADPALPRAAIERVLARATELQSQSSDAPDVVSESRLMEIAREVGIDTASLRQAMAEERARSPIGDAREDTGFVLESLGPGTLDAQRVVLGTPAQVMAKLDAWMPRMESLTLKRRTGDRMSWEPRHDKVGNFLRSLGMGGRRFDLVRLDQVVASVTAIDAERTLVRFDIDAFKARRAQRTLAVAIGAVLGLVGVGLSIPIVLFAAESAASVGIPVLAVSSLGMTYATWRAVRHGYRELIARAHLRLEQTLDELDRGGMQPPPSLARQVTAALLR